jgi:hypothetical protein
VSSNSFVICLTSFPLYLNAIHFILCNPFLFCVLRICLCWVGFWFQCYCISCFAISCYLCLFL